MMHKLFIIISTLLLLNSNALACYDGEGSGKCGWYGTSPYGAGIGFGGSYNNTQPSYPTPQNITIHLDSRYGAIAASNNAKYTTSINALSKRAATTEALSRCKQDGGIGCRIVLSIRNGCFSVAEGFYKNGTTMTFHEAAEVKGKAENLALQQCYKHGGFEKCSILIPEECSLPTLPN